MFEVLTGDKRDARKRERRGPPARTATAVKSPLGSDPSPEAAFPRIDLRWINIGFHIQRLRI